MPELGKATYELIFDTTQVGKMAAAEEEVLSSTTAMEGSLGGVEEAILRLARISSAGFSRVGASSEEGAAAMARSATAMEASAARVGAAGKAAATETEGAFARFGKVGGGLGQMLGLGAAYFAIKGGLDWMKTAQQGILAIRGAIKSTGGVAGVTVQSAIKLSDALTQLTGNTRGENLQLEQMLLRFRNIRDMGTPLTDMFHRTSIMVENIATVTGRSTKMIALALGKTLNDPANNLNSLGRAGIRFNKVQQDMVKAVQAGKASFQGYTGVLGAQLYVFDQLKSYEGAAAAQSQSLTVQWKRAKDALDKSSAAILRGFLPVLVQLGNELARVAGFLAHHTDLLRTLIEVYVAAKIAAIAFNGAMKLGNILMTITNLSKLKVALFGVRAAEVATTEEAGVMDAAMLANPVGAVLIGIAAIAGALYLLSKRFKLVRDAAHAAWAEIKKIPSGKMAGGNLNPLNGFGRFGTWLGNETYNAIHGKDNTPSAASTGLSPREITQLRARYDLLKKTMNTQDALAALMNQYPGLTETDVSVITGAHHAADKKKAGAPKKKVKPPTVPQGGYLSGVKGGDFLTQDLRIALLNAGLTTSTADDIKVLKQQEAFLLNMLHHHKMSKTVKIALLTEINSVDSNLKSLVAAKIRTGKKGAYTGILPEKMALAYQTALGTTGLKDDEKVLREEEKYLEKLIKQHKLHGAKLMQAATELARIKVKLAADLKKTLLTSDQQAAKEMQSFVDTRGSFFSQFASSVFNVGGPAGADVFGSTKTTNIEQNNTFQEMPKDRFQVARQMAKAAGGV